MKKKSTLSRIIKIIMVFGIGAIGSFIGLGVLFWYVGNGAPVMLSLGISYFAASLGGALAIKLIP